MCTVSMIGDHYSDKWKQYPWYVEPPNAQPLAPTTIFQNISEVSRAEFDALKKEVEEMKQLLVRAKAYDEKNNEPHCEMEDKVALLKQVAKAVGVNLDDIFKPPQ